MKVSVVVPTYKRRGLLERCLGALAEQDFPRREFEILVADNAGENEIADLVDVFALENALELRYVAAAAKRGPAFARNAGWRAARGDVIAFTDDDCIPDKNWLKEGYKVFAGDHRTAAATGKTVVPLSAAPTDYELNEAGLARAEFITANCFVQRQVLEMLGGFDERFTAAWREDSDLHFRLLERDLKIARAGRARVVHPVRAARFGVSLGQQRKSMFDALLYKKHPALFRRKIGFAPVNYYLLCAACAAAAGFAANGDFLFAPPAFLLWFFLTAEFCARRLRRTARTARHVSEMIVTSVLIPPVAVFWRLAGALRFRVLFF
ncbi:MAG TPA: glycosyltransferase [Pyrinomonadaceae bacterium]|jgi:glycosyltransferase involved in cell wall biosynthesis